MCVCVCVCVFVCVCVCVFLLCQLCRTSSGFHILSKFEFPAEKAYCHWLCTTESGLNTVKLWFMNLGWLLTILLHLNVFVLSRGLLEGFLPCSFESCALVLCVETVIKKRTVSSVYTVLVLKKFDCVLTGWANAMIVGSETMTYTKTVSMEQLNCFVLWLLSVGWCMTWIKNKTKRKRDRRNIAGIRLNCHVRWLFIDCDLIACWVCF